MYDITLSSMVKMANDNRVACIMEPNHDITFIYKKINIGYFLNETNTLKFITCLTINTSLTRISDFWSPYTMLNVPTSITRYDTYDKLSHDQAKDLINAYLSPVFKPVYKAPSCPKFSDTKSFLHDFGLFIKRMVDYIDRELELDAKKVNGCNLMVRMYWWHQAMLNRMPDKVAVSRLHHTELIDPNNTMKNEIMDNGHYVRWSAFDCDGKGHVKIFYETSDIYHSNKHYFIVSLFEGRVQTSIKEVSADLVSKIKTFEFDHRI